MKKKQIASSETVKGYSEHETDNTFLQNLRFFPFFHVDFVTKFLGRWRENVNIVTNIRFTIDAGS